ncbi:DNA mismatch repair protein MutL [Suicoccus acidiformans]|uniref:DNA mismatch repair protein MutL n=1 Tax=Suicoccus acidiformans TaxID=2036206 RepID=A0A347WLA8_9LACT|nr:DNA mismatch repair endonuclease MutL [Suicoccus acidiformans]AXY25865.1 DNA mismatch repair protein MutL [Suicoccus acidiformans]
MGQIRIMPEALANQIAAGEVVERPASVVKELVENAIDAGSQMIQVELKEAGIQAIRVTDDGLGMSEEDLQMAFQPHATSKIYDVHDLFNIHTLGFRGEALASIGSVAKVTLTSKRSADETSHYIVVEGSTITDQGKAAARPGTSILVESLFYNTPARLKHLKSLRTELRHSIQFVQNIALGYPHIRFILKNDGETIFQTAGRGDLRQAIANVYQPAIARDLLAIQGEDNDFRIEGFISPATLTRTSKQYIHLMINHRPVRHYGLNETLIRAYGRQLMTGRYPIAVIDINLDARLLDVNVHPTKQTVRLSKEEELADLIKQAVIDALEVSNPVPSVEVEDVSGPRFDLQAEPLYEQASLPLTAKASEPEIGQSQRYEAFEQDPLPTQPAYIEEHTNAFQKEKPDTIELAAEPTMSQDPLAQEVSQPVLETEQEQKLAFSDLRYVGQIHGTYLVAEGERGFYLIDQHAAQERIRYEQFMKETPEIQQQQLLMPMLFNFTADEMLQIEERTEALHALGVYLEVFGPTTMQMESYPNWIEAAEVEGVVRDLVEMVVEKPNLTVSEYQEAAIIMQSCRGAIKANHRLSNEEAIDLIQAMDGLDDPYHCPHGRPVFVEFTSNTLEKLFKRIQDPHASHARSY